MSKQDPTNQARNRKVALKDVNSRLNTAAKNILRNWKESADPVRTSRKEIQNNQNLVFWSYDMTEQEVDALYEMIVSEYKAALGVQALRVSADWFYSQYTEKAYVQGVINENSALEALAPDIVAPLVTFGITISLLSLPEFMRRNVNVLIQDQYFSFSGLSESTSKQVYRTIINGMEAGKSKATITRELMKRFDVSRSNAKRIVDTEVNKSNNNARIDSILAYRNAGANIAVMHISALLKTTRSTHAARHGNVYTPEQQQRWWNEGANRINCHCSVRPVRVNRDGTVTDVKQQKRIKAEGRKVFGR